MYILKHQIQVSSNRDIVKVSGTEATFEIVQEWLYGSTEQDWSKGVALLNALLRKEMVISDSQKRRSLISGMDILKKIGQLV